jgi:hypothetical protein
LSNGHEAFLFTSGDTSHDSPDAPFLRLTGIRPH